MLILIYSWFRLSDGIFVGTAFLNCNRDLAITISAATIYHEIAQEVADYFMLTRFCNIPPLKALCLNFINGLSVLCGAIVIVSIEDMSSVAIGSILAVSSGVYFYISVAECFPRAREAHKSFREKTMSLAAFVTGVVPIGLVLLNHGHCEAGH
jgi:zinc transporter ZupT